MIKWINLTIFKNMRESKKLLLHFILFGFLSVLGIDSVFASSFDNFSVQFPENTELRQHLYEQMTGSNKDALSVLPEWIAIESTGVCVNFFTVKEINEHGGTVYFCFSHGTDLDFTKGTKGSYIIKRNLDEYDDINYGIQQIKIFYKNDDYSFLRIRESSKSEESIMEIELLGRVVQKNIRVPLSLAELSLRSFSELAELTSSYVDWNYYISDYRKLYGNNVRILSETINPMLGFIQDRDDGAIDTSGNFVFIDSLDVQSEDGGLNCSGFAKWIIDGIYKPEAGTNIDISLLKKKHFELRGNEWSDKLEDLDPYFGLDWTRSLAHEVLKLYEPGAPVSAVDVDNLRYHGYKENIGYPIDNLSTVLYELAVTYPQNFYLGSLNSKSNEPPYLRQHTHVVVIFPYIDMKGNFQSVVYSANEKISVDYLKSHWKDNYIHLVHVEASSRFEPSGIDFNPVIRR